MQSSWELIPCYRNGGNCQNHFSKQLRILVELKAPIPHDPVFLLLGTDCYRNSGMCLARLLKNNFIAALSVQPEIGNNADVHPHN